MPTATFHQGALTGVVACVPRTVARIDDAIELLGGNPAQIERLKKTIGLNERRVVDAKTTAHDLCLAAARVLLGERGLGAGDLDAILCVTQTPDYPQPANAALLHRDLGAAKTCAALDVNLGCSGYVYGLWLAHSLVESGGCRRVLVAAGDTISRIVSDEDRALAPLFGDGGSATLVERVADAAPTTFQLFTDGSGFDSLIVPAGGMREPGTEAKRVRSEDSAGNRRAATELHMDGTAVFTFSITAVPEAVRSTAEAAGQALDGIDAFVFHQANRYILSNIAKRLGIPLERDPMGTVERYGNQSSASIPTALCHERADLLRSSTRHPILLCGFGVGLSWGTCLLHTGHATVASLIEYPC